MKKLDINECKSIKPIHGGDVNGVNVWAIRCPNGWGYVTDFYCDPFSEPKTGGAAISSMPTGNFETSAEAISAGLQAMREMK